MAAKAATYDEIMALLAEISSGQSETKELLDQVSAQQKLTDEQIKATSAQQKLTEEQFKQTDKQITRLAKQVAGITDTIGLFAQEQVRPKIIELFGEKGIELEDTLKNVKIKKDGNFYYEMDLLLINTIYSVVVEVKNKLRKDDIDDHLKRLKKVEALPHRFVRGTKVYGAVAGMIVDEDIQNYAFKKGLYVVKPKGDGVEISNPENFKPRVWQAGTN